MAERELLDLALLGSRARGFNHDVASKLQSLMMALDELDELATNDDDLRRVAETATSAMREIHAHLGAFRALARGGAPESVSLRELMDRAARRASVKLEGDVPARPVTVFAHAAVQAVALACELVGGRAGDRVRVSMAGDDVVIEGDRPGSPGELSSSEALELIAHAMRRDGGDARRDGDRVVLTFG